jgi:sugar phosphate permease
LAEAIDPQATVEYQVPPEHIQRAGADAALPPHPPGYRWRRGRNWFFLGLLYAAYYLCRYNLGIVAPEITKEYGFNEKQFGAISSGRDGGYAVGQFINGLFADGLGGKQAMAIGAIGTIAFNALFGFASWSHLTWILVAFVIIRMGDGYMQAFGAPGMVKINTSWFQRRERGRFAGIFGGMIQLGAIGVGLLGKYLLIGFTVSVFGYVLFHFPKQNWRAMFFVPSAIIFVILILMWLNVKNNPEEAGYSIPHDDDEHGGDIEQALPLSYVFKKIATNAMAWLNAGAYFCTGFVRRSIELWWVLYLAKQWGADKNSSSYSALVWALPISAFVGSFTSGLISDTLFKGKRAPVAALLYLMQGLAAIASIFVLKDARLAGPLAASILLTVISFACNSTHSIIGTAAAMDLGGRKMSGFACGLIDSFQYFGSILAGFMLGEWIHNYGWDALFYSMIPFSAVGTILMGYVWLSTRGRDVKGS